MVETTWYVKLVIKQGFKHLDTERLNRQHY